MNQRLVTGLGHELRYTVPPHKTVPRLYPEAPEFRRMPEVFATGYLVGLLEWACMQMVNPYLDAGQQTVGTHIDVSHAAATPPGVELRVTATLVQVVGRRLRFEVLARDGADVVSSGTHERCIIDRTRFDDRLASRVAASAA